MSMRYEGILDFFNFTATEWINMMRITTRIPYSQYYLNNYRDNADAHLKRSVMGREVVVAITNGT